MIKQRSAVLTISFLGLGLFATAAGCGQEESVDLTTGALFNQRPLAFQANTGTLWVDQDQSPGPQNSFSPMKSGSRPANTILSSGLLEFGFQASNSHFIIGQFSGSAFSFVDSGGSMAGSTNPSIAEMPNGQIGFAFQGANGHLWMGTNGPSSGFDTGGALAGGSSPAVTRNSSFLAVAFRGANGHLWVLPTGTNGVDTGASMTESPAITTTSDGQVPVAFRGANGHLWVIPNINSSLSNGFDTGSVIKAGTSPAIAANTFNAGNTFVVFNENTTGKLAVYSVAPRSLMFTAIDAMFLATPIAINSAAGFTAAIKGTNSNLWVTVGTGPVQDTGLTMN